MNNLSLVLATFVAYLGMTGAAVYAQQNSPLIVNISLGKIHRGIHFHWKLTNDSDREIVVYSNFLRGPGLIHKQDAAGNIQIYTSLTSKLDVGVYYFPNPEFITLRPHEITEGDFIDPMKLGKWAHTNSRITLNVAYGEDLPKIKAALHEQLFTGRGHPANPLVDWQQFARGNELILLK